MASSIQKVFMSEFDPIAYLNSRFQDSLPPPPATAPQPPVDDKLAAVLRARQEKGEALRAFRDRGAQVEAAQRKSYDNSVIGILGMNPDGLAATALNTAVGVGSGFTNIATNIGSSIHSVDAASQTHAIPQEARAAYGRWKQGAATESDMALLNGVNQGSGRRPGVADAQRKAANYGETNFQRLQGVDKSLDNAQAIRDLQKETFADRVYRGDQQAFESQLMEQGAGDLEKTSNAVSKLKSGDYASGSMDLVSGLAGLFANVGTTAIDNPKAALGYIAENAGQLVLASGGAAGMALTNLPYAMDAFGQGIEAYRNKNNGALPSNDLMLEMAGKAASLAVAETAGDKITLGAGKITRGISKAIQGAADLATKPISREGLKNALKGVTNLATDSAPSRIAQNAVTGALGEFATEGYQTAMEENIKGNDASAEDIYKGAAAGALAGGGIAGSLNTVSEVAQMFGSAAKRVEEKNAQQDAMESAVKTGDITSFVDTTSPTFDPHKGLQALVGNGTQEAATPENRKANLEKATALLDQIKANRDRAQSAFDSVSPDARKAEEATLASYKDMLAQTADPALKSMLEEEIRITQAELDKSAIKPEELKARQDAFDKASKDFEKAQALHTELTNLVKHDEAKAQESDAAKLQKYASPVSMAPEELDAQVKLADSKVDTTNPEAMKASSQAASRVISLAMASPGSVSVQTAQQLASNMGNGLSQAQRNYLRAFSEARLAHNLAMTAKGVQKEVFEGDKTTNQKGIVTYEAEMAQAVATNNKAKAQGLLTGLTRFASDHAFKLEAATKAMALFEKTGVPQQIYSNGQRQWSVADTALPEAERRSKGGLEIGAKSAGVIRTIKQEVHALNMAAAAHQAAFDMAFGGGNSENAAAVPASRVSSTETQSTSVKPSAPPVRAAKEEEVEEGRSNQSSQEEPTHFKGPESTQVSQESEQAAPQITDPNAPGYVPPWEEVPVTPEEVQSEPESGGLSAYQEKHPEGASYTEVNLIQRNFTQHGKKEGDSTGRPLVEVKDFLTALREQKVKVSDFVEGNLTDKQRELVKMFAGLAKQWDAKIEAAINHKQALEYRYQDMFSYLVNPDGSVDQNVKTAIALAAFTLLAENIEKGKHNTDQDINRILLKDDDAEVSPEAKRILGKVGLRRNMLISSAGQKAVQALGLRAKKDAPQDLMARLEMALGAHAIKLLAEEGLVELTEVPSEQMNTLLDSKYKQDAGVDNWFVRPMRDSSGELISENQQIKEAYQKTLGVLDKLFGTESALKLPSLSPIPFNQKTTRNTLMGIPAKLKAIVTRQNAQPNRVDEQKWKVISQLSRETVLFMAGFEELDESRIHASRRDSVEAKNDGLEREYNRMMDFVGGVLEKTEGGLKNAIYFSHSVWKQQRVGIETNALNPQTSKLHRHLIYKESWESEVDTDSKESLDNFKLRVLEGLGVKTDKKSNATNLVGFDARFDPNHEKNVSPEDKAKAQKLSDAVDALVATAIYGEEMNPYFEEDIREGVLAAGEEMHSFDALMAMAQYRAAEQKGDSTFTTRLMGEIDGVTNGPMLSHLLLGAAATAKDLLSLLNRGGFFEQSNDHSQYNIWREDPAHRDLYENTTHGMMLHARELLDDPKNPVPGEIFTAVYSITGNLEKDDGSVTSDGRNIIKTPLTAMVFGSSMTRAVESMAENFVAKVYSRIEEINEKKESPADLMRTLNTLLAYGRNGKGMKGKGRLESFPLNASIEALMEGTFSPAQEEALKEAFRQSLGRAVRGVMNENFGTFMESRRTFNHAAEMTFRLYNAVYAGMRKTFIEKLVKEGAITVNPTTGNPIHDLTAKQEEAFRKSIESVMPELNTYLSSLDKKGHSGLFIGKSSRRGSQEHIYKSENKFATQVKGTGRKSMLTRGYKAVNDLPGVGMLPMGAHSSDSAISHLAAEMLEVLNVHDAHGSGLKDYLQAGKNLNASTFKVMLGYSPATEMLEAFHRVIKGTSQILAQEGVPDAVKAELASAFKEAAKARNQYVRDEDQKIQPQDILKRTLDDMTAMAYMADKTKLEVLSQLAYVDQYALEGGNYEVTEDDRKAAKDRLDAVQLNQPASVDAALTSILEAAESTPAKTEIQEDSISREEEQDQNDPSPAKPSAWGEVGTPEIQGDKAMEAAFIARGELSAKQVLNALNSRLSGKGSNMAEFNQRLLSVLNKLVDPELKVKMIFPDTPVESVLNASPMASRAWYVNKDGKGEIYVLSPDFKTSGLTAEVLMHELTHAALATTIQNELDAKAKDPAYTSEALSLVNELESLRLKAQEHISSLDEAKQAQFQPAIQNVHELVSWGLTNPAFQKEVLNQVTLQPKTKKTALVKGMKVFIDALTGLLFRNSTKSRQAQAVNGMTILVNNASGLFNQAAQNKAGARELTLAMSATNPAMGYSTRDIFDALGAGTSTGPAQERHLLNLLDSIVLKLHGPAGAFKVSLMQDQTLTPQDVFAKAIATGEAPFASQLVGAPFRLNDQERFVAEQVEATMRIALTSEGQTTAAYSALSRLYKEAYAKLQAKDFHDGDWSQASQADMDAANEKRDFLFKLDPDASKRSNHLARFAALALVSPELRGKLSFDLDTPSQTKAKGFFQRLEQLFQNVLSWFEARITKGYSGQQADARVTSLVEQLIDIEARRRESLRKAANGFDPMAPIEKTTKKAMEGIRNKIADIGRSKFFKQSKYGVVRAAGSVSAIIATDRVKYFLDAINEIRNENFKGEQQGLLAGILNDVRGPKALFEQLLRLTKHNETLRKEAIDGTAKLALSMFRDGGKKLTKETKNALTQVFLRSGAHVLLDDFSMQDLASLLSDPNALDKAIESYAEALAGERYADYYANQAKVLGYYLATGKTTGPLLMLNAGNIARLYGTRHSGSVTEQQAQRAEKTLDVLTTLYALKYNKGSQRYLAQQALLEEMARTDDQGNGVEGLLHVHRALEKDSRERLFSGNEALMQKAYVPEIVNPHVELRMVTATEGRLLQAQGFSLVHAMSRDSSDTVQEGSVLYARHGGGQMPWQTGIMSYTGMGTKGTESFDAQMTGSNAPAIGVNKQPEIDALFRTNSGFDPAKVKKSFLAPIMDGDGHVSGWRYLMQADTRDNVLERNSSFEDVMGKMAGSILDKETTQEHNRTVVQALLEEYRAEAPRKMDQYLLVGEDSTDPELQAIYRMLPESTRREIEDAWGMKGMRVKAEMIDLVFGYRKLSLSSAFDKAVDQRTPIETIFVGFVENLMTYVGEMKYPGDHQKAQAYAKRAGVMVRKGERAWQEIVQEVKDVIVIRSGVVLLGNVISNMTLLAAQGVSMKDMARYHAIAYKAVTAYQHDAEELAQLQGQLAADYVMGDEKEIRRRITELEDALARNPVKNLIEAGMLPTIVEDVETEADPYSYKSQLQQKTGKFTSKINPHVLSVVQHATVSRGTPLYNFLHKQTQMSDFVARYTLFQHLTTRKEDPLSRQDALHQASESFINYDIPMHRTMQYIDDMGLMMFNKYFFRIQRVLLKTTKENPARVLALMLMKNYLVNIPTVLDASAIHHIGNNPFSSGALQLPFLMDDLLTSKLGESLLK